MPHLHGMSAAFAEALGRHATEAREIGCSFAGRPVRLRVAGSTLAQRTQRAFAHLRIGGDAQASTLRIDLWDETETGVPCPSSDPAAEPERAWVACGGSLGASPDGRYVSFRYGDSVTVLDRDAQHMIGCRRDGSHLSGGEYSKPLLLLLSIWYYDRGVQLLHAGLLARDGMGVLLPGDSGTGKSTTCLAGLTQGLEFLGDDFVGIERAGAGTFLGHSIFNTACLASRNLGRFPDLEPLAVASASPEEEKPILFLSEIHPERLRATVPVRAVVLLRIRSERTEIRPATRVEALRQFAASTLHTVVPRPGREALRMIAEVVESVPAYWLLLGPEMRDIGPGIDGILARACGVDAA